MYHEESIIDGVLHIRSTPDGEWRKLSAEAITLKYMEAKCEAARYRTDAKINAATNEVMRRGEDELQRRGG